VKQIVSVADEPVKAKAPKEWDPRGLSIQEVEKYYDREFNLDEYLHYFEYPRPNDIESFGHDRLLSFDGNKKWTGSILGDRLLYKRGSLVLNGASGIGKSSLMMQAVIFIFQPTAGFCFLISAALWFFGGARDPGSL
jgi:hypothetical protein